MSNLSAQHQSNEAAHGPVAASRLPRGIAEAAAWAPSPDNNQPWVLSTGSDYLEIRLDRSRSLPSDVNGMFDLVAIGAAVENAFIAASEAGLQAVVETVVGDRLGSDDKTAVPVAQIRWGQSMGSVHGHELAEACAVTQSRVTDGTPIPRDALAAWIEQRHTCRRPYSRRPVAAEILDRLAAEVGQFSDVHVHWLSDRPAIRSFAWLVGQSDRLRFEQEAFHRELFRQLRFTPQEADSSRDGLDLRVLDLPPGAGLVLRLISNWRVLSAANRFGASWLLSLPSIVSVIGSGAIGLISVARPAASEFVKGGRAFQRLWLAATAEGLQLHPLGSLPIFVAHLDQLNAALLTRKQLHRAKRVKANLVRLVPELSQRTLLIAFRIGHGKPSRFRSQRRDVTEKSPIPS